MANSILGPIERVRVSTLVPYPGNARRGDVKAIAESLNVNGQFSPVVFQASTRHILLGNHTVQAMQQIRWAECDASSLDVDDEQARKIVLAANRTADLATYDLDALAVLLRDVDDLSGTGFTDDDVTELLDDDEPEGDIPDRGSARQIGVAVYCDTVEKQMELMARLLEEGWEARAL